MSEPALYPGCYSSNVMKIFVEHLDHHTSQVLDVGPVCESNIHFLADRARRVLVCDLFLRLVRCRREGNAELQALLDLDFPANSADGILLWDVVDRLEDPEVLDLVGRCKRMIRPDGMLMMVVLGKEAVSAEVKSFAIKDGAELDARDQPHLSRLPVRRRNDRVLTELFAPFRTIKAFVYHHGHKEFLMTSG
jgi:hypothetical protein